MKAKIYLRIFTISISMLVSSQFVAQEMNGLTFSNYSGISSGMLNPALMTGSKVFMDINLIGGMVSASNDIAYFLPENKTMRKFISMDTLAFSEGEFKFNRSYNYFDNEDAKYLTANARVLGPSFMVQAGHHAFGLSTAVRSMHGGNNIPYEMPIIFYEGLEFPEYDSMVFDDYNYSFVSMTWSEIGVSYAYDIINYYDNKLTAGITVKALFGHEGAYVGIEHAKFRLHQEVTSDGTYPAEIEFLDLDAELGFSIPYDANTNTVQMEALTRGYGAGVDIGFVFTKKESIFNHQGYRALCTSPYQDYKYRIGVSILDIGSVTFKEGAELHKFENASTYWVDYDTIEFRGFSETLETYSEVFYGDPDESHAGDEVKIGLPTALSLQFDYKLKEKYYISAMWMQPIRFNLHTLWRPAQIAITPRFETRYVGVSVPVSLYNYNEPRIGLALRLFTFTFGTDRMGSIIGISKFTGMDVYFSMKFNLVKGDCLRFRGSDW